VIFRAVLSFLLCVLALAVGIYTICLTASNRVRSRDLDTTQRWCEVYSRQNEFLRAENIREEWMLVSGDAEREGGSADG
jgi:hypothetical protein